MGWNIVALVAVFAGVASGRCVSRVYPPQGSSIIPTIQPTIQPTIVDGAIVKSLIDTIQLFIVSDLLEETLPEKETIVTPAAYYGIPSYDYIDYDSGCDILPYEIVYDEECPDFVTALVPRKPCVPKKPLYVNFGLNEELILPPLAPELPLGLGYLPGGLPVVAKAFSPCCKCGACSTAALPICSPYSCTVLATPLCPDMSPYVKPIVL